VPATGLEPLTAKLINLNETVETGNDKIHHSSLICLVNELAHGLAVPEQVRMIVANVLHCWAPKTRCLSFPTAAVPHCWQCRRCLGVLSRLPITTGRELHPSRNRR